MKYRASKVALLGLLFALSIVMSVVESSVSGLIPIPGIKLGLSNVVTMYCLFCLGKGEAFTLAVMKSLFVLLTRGAVGAALSLSGGILSLSVMLLLHYLSHGKCSYSFVSVCGGVAHNAGQLLIAVPILGSSLVFYYFPILAISGVAMGLLTGFLLRRMMPYLNRIFS